MNGNKVLTIGTFDMLHEGHLLMLETCRKIAGSGRLIVGVNSDEFVTSYKGRPPIQTYTTRESVMCALRVVDDVRRNDDNGRSLIWEVRPDILVIGSDWATRDYYVQIGMSREDLDSIGVTLLYTNYTLSVTSTELRENLERRNRE